jgi:hypothetical protein
VRGQKFRHSSGAARREEAGVCLDVIACDKREAFAQGREATKQSTLSFLGEMDCFASLAMTISKPVVGR